MGIRNNRVPIRVLSGLNQIGFWFYPDSLRGGHPEGGVERLAIVLRDLLKTQRVFSILDSLWARCITVLCH